MTIFAFSPKTVNQYTLNGTMSTFRCFTCPATLVVFRLLEFLTIWDVCNPSFNVSAYNFTLWRSHHLFKSKFSCGVCR